MATKIQGGSDTSGLANVTTDYAVKTTLERDAVTNPLNVSAIKFYSENDNGTKTGTPYLSSPETDEDYRLRVTQDTMLDNETFNYTAQNTGKHTYATSTLTTTWTTAGLTTNGGNVTTTGTGTTFGSYAEFPLLTSCLLYAEFTGSLSAALTTNFIIDVGLFRRGASTAYAPTDGVYFRINASGVFGVINYNGAETATSAFDFTHTNSKKYQFIITVSEREVHFWIDGVLYSSIETPTGQGSPFLSATLPFSVRHAHTGTTGAVINFVLNDYGVSVSGANIPKTLGELSNSVLGSYQGLSGGTMGSLATLPNSANPTAAAPSNTALTANLPAGLGGQGSATAAVGGSTDGIWGSYQVPAGTVSIQGKRLKVTGVKISCINIGAAVATTNTTVQFSLAFGHTNVSLATTDAVAAKAPRKVALGFATWIVGATIGSSPSQGDIVVSFADAPIYVNPGEFIALVGKFVIGTATASQVISYVWQPIYSWE
jgi:hypothetical protein